MGLPYAPNSVPSGLNPGGRRLTTRIHLFTNITSVVQILPFNINRIAFIMIADEQITAPPEVSIDPDITTSWHVPYAIFDSGVTIYGTMPLFARPQQPNPDTTVSIIIYEYVYE